MTENSQVTNAEEARAALESGRETFRELVLGLSDEEWSSKSDNGGWSNGQLCWHVALTTGGANTYVSRLRRNKGFSPPRPMMAMFHMLSLMMVRIRSRGATPESVLALFDESHGKAMALIDTVADDEWGNGGVFLGEQITVGGAFGLLRDHVDEHAAEIRRG